MGNGEQINSEAFESRADGPLNLLMVLPGYPSISGIPSYAKWLVDELKKSHNVKVLVPGYEKQISSKRLDGVDVFSLRIPMPYSKKTPVKTFAAWLLDFPRFYKQLKQLLAAERIQVIHTTFHSYNYVFRLLRFFGGPPYLVTLHGSETVYFEEIPRFDRLISKNIIDGANCVAAVSGTLRGVAQKRFPSTNIFTAYNGIELSGQETALERDSLAIDLPNRFCILVGRLHPVKGIDIAIEAWQLVLKQEPDIHLVIVGGGECREEYETKISELGLNGRVHLLGALDNNVVRALMRMAEVLVMPSRSEGFPAVCLEAAKAALPIVASKVGGIPEVVEDSVNGYLVESSDSVGLAEKVTYLLGDQNLRVTFGRRLFEKVTDKFSSKKGAETYCKLYRICSGQAKSDIPS